MKTYYYRTVLVNSTRQLGIHNEHDEIIGYIQRVYPSKRKQMIDTLFFSNRLSKNYEIRDAEKKLVMSVIDETPLFKKRSQKVIYQRGGSEVIFYLKDPTVFGDWEKVTFTCGQMKCSMQNLLMQPATFSMNNRKVAEWKIPIKHMLKTQVKLFDERFETEILLIIGCLHSYYHAAGY